MPIGLASAGYDLSVEIQLFTILSFLLKKVFPKRTFYFQKHSLTFTELFEKSLWGYSID